MTEKIKPKAWEYLGAHLTDKGTVFRTYAPSASKVCLITELTGWNELPMHKTDPKGIWELYLEFNNIIPSAVRKRNGQIYSHPWIGKMYQYRIYDKNFRKCEHSDPFGFFSEIRPKKASKIWPVSYYNYRDNDWMAHREYHPYKAMNIYEIHAGSWKKAAGNRYLNYRELAKKLVPYLKENGFNYVELLPICEHPMDHSWGYQITGYFSPTSRYGNPDDFRFFVDYCHQNGIGVIMDFVTVHFAVDRHGLSQYDGSRLFEKVGKSEWGSYLFDHSKPYVLSFFKSCADFWIREYHIDGLRYDAVSHLIYNNGKPENGIYNAGIRFLKELNLYIHENHPHVFLIAEDPTIYEGVTKAVHEGGLGFDYKWCMGWTFDTLSFLQKGFPERYYDSKKMAFTMDYFRNERYLLPISHDETGRFHKSLYAKMPGRQTEKLAQLKALYMFMMAHPGKKLIFSGNETAMEAEWQVNKEINLRGRARKGFKRLTRDAGLVYQGNRAFYEWDYVWEGFEWLPRYMEGSLVYGFIRRGPDSEILCIFNFSDEERIYHYDTRGKNYELMMDSESDIYDGNEKTGSEWLHDVCQIRLAPFSGKYYILR